MLKFPDNKKSSQQYIGYIFYFFTLFIATNIYFSTSNVENGLIRFIKSYFKHVSSGQEDFPILSHLSGFRPMVETTLNCHICPLDRASSVIRHHSLYTWVIMYLMYSIFRINVVFVSVHLKKNTYKSAGTENDKSEFMLIIRKSKLIYLRVYFVTKI